MIIAKKEKETKVNVQDLALRLKSVQISQKDVKINSKLLETLKIKMMSVDLDNHSTPTASVLYYIQLSNKFGVKFWINSQVRNANFVRQNFAYSLNFAPLAICKVNALTSDGRKLYGFITEHVEIADLPSKQVNGLIRKMQIAGWCGIDIGRTHNTGLIGKKPVVYDFDDKSLSVASANFYET